MKNIFKKAKKGFTIVELVIVIGVIAILSAILIPTFVSLTDKANDAALQSNLSGAYSAYITEANLDDNDGDKLAAAGRTQVYLSEDKNLVTNNAVETPNITYYTCGEDGVWVKGTAKIVAGTGYTFASVYTGENAPSFNTYYVYYLAKAAA